MSKSRRIMIVEDEAELADVIRDYLARENIDAEILTDGTRAVETILRTQPDLVVLDIMLPGKDGLTICRELRARSDVPIIMETARVEEIDRLLGLELGADDYMCKPFSPRELVARIKAVLRRTAPQDDPRGMAGGLAGGLELDEDSWKARLNGRSLGLTRREFTLLAVLFRRPGRVFSRSQLLDLAFPDDAEVFDRTIDTHIKNIRSKIRDIAPDMDLIRSVYGVGYTLET